MEADAGDTVQQQAQATQDALLDRALGLLGDETLTVLALLLVGLMVGIAATGVVRLFLPNVDGDGPKAWATRSLLLTRVGAASSGLWTAAIVGWYLATVDGLGWFMVAVVALGAGLVAAGGSKPAYKPVCALYRYGLGKLRRKIEADGGDASDMTETKFNPPKDPPKP